jgi:ArsR family transcriptional regulator
MMTQVNNKARPLSPATAAACRRKIDRLLDPELFKALADATRVKLLACLAKCGRACSVGEVAACCDVDLSVVSRHLSHLARAGVVEAEREGRAVLYRVRYGGLSKALRELADAIDECCPEGAACGPGGCGCKTE